MTTKLDLFNQAISLVGGQARLVDVNDSGPEAEQCRRWYETAKKMVFKMAYWPWVRRSVKLTLYAENDFADEWVAGDPPLPYKYSYLLPEDYINAREVRNIEANNYRGSEPQQFIIEYDSTLPGQILATNCENAVLLYMADSDDPESWDVLIQQAIAYALAEKISISLSGDPNFSVQMLEKAQIFARRALVNQANAEDRRLVEPQSPILQSRYGLTLIPGQDIPSGS